MDNCIEWDKSRSPKGYGRVKYKGKMRYAHRVAWIKRYGYVPEGMHVLHRCDNPPCINIEHLFLGTQADNMKDMAGKGRGRNGNTGKERCKNGHPLDKDNTYIRPKGQRDCKTCKRNAARLRYLTMV
jgi:hypothetical protein